MPFQKEPAMTKSSERLLLLTLALIQFTHIVDFMILMPLGPQLMRLFSISPKEFGLLVSAYTFSAGICGFLSAFLVDRFDRKHILLVLYSGFILGTLACALAPSYPVLLVARVLTGSFGGILAAAVMAVIGDAIPMERRGSAMGIVTSAFSAASVLGVPLGLWLASLFDWHSPFLFLSGVSMGVFFLILKGIPSLKAHLTPSAPQQHPFQILGDVFKNPPQIWALILTVFMMIGQFAIIPFLSPSMVANVGFSEAQLTLIYLLGGATTLITGPLIGKLADRYGKLKVLVLFFGLSIFPQFLITHLGVTPLYLALLLSTSFFIVSGGRIIPAMALITGTVSPQRRGSFMSIQSSVQQLSAGVASLMAGMIVFKDAQGHLEHYGVIGWIAVITTLACMGIAPQLLKQAQEPVLKQPQETMARPETGA
ncbi:MFS transporter [bacterium (Candidatus Blackallbacteria) CG17_big_fil_post_rev_8_21_14_2_50_48_46]|uniref:MFS transporter n=1 Tax=bacterium (Candidatus Blackallbacteria) CG17_big_fil_post_rev_8_21_14_2_50_48_46 TaxID=2014261 RepID=A0A2M7FZN0_9BACT|nr:MAG: MFS transporter [bacterium (Candidatus Blackallbacteria) CG18_big_fil_WC_8_21_14_2_50_49_26]PIW14738.1 MAG: MFS transporter [bacterium (Candidatus Blackallbacteria) CG17_big_fil_post_rev_8_21_14_2_50_48_46]PIW50840.1 MAG: MFS transporter [bacterium (Candidatus Blackallbacteria) CG13_big_fil_rev_8_21_14_2_50_49_14]